MKGCIQLTTFMLVISLGIAFGRQGIAEEKIRDRPNILLILADDLSWFDIGCYGSKDARTPQIDQLSREGMRFDHAFTREKGWE